MHNCTGWIVRSTAGHDRDGLFCVVGAEQEGYLLLADGKRRKLARPKRKKPGHVAVEDREYMDPVIQCLRTGQAVSDRALRRALAAFRTQSRRV